MGSTVNLASRMESTGVPGLIHMSESVAAAAGLPLDLLTERTVDVKGVGQLTTYLFDPKNAAAALERAQPPPPQLLSSLPDPDAPSYLYSGQQMSRLGRAGRGGSGNGLGGWSGNSSTAGTSGGSGSGKRHPSDMLGEDAARTQLFIRKLQQQQGQGQGQGTAQGPVKQSLRYRGGGGASGSSGALYPLSRLAPAGAVDASEADGEDAL
jgi:hypothetical protein